MLTETVFQSIDERDQGALWVPADYSGVTHSGRVDISLVQSIDRLTAKSEFRFSSAGKPHSFLRHICDAIGFELIVTLGLVCCVIYTCFFPSAAAAANLPGRDAVPSDIVKFLLTSREPRLSDMRDGPAMKRVIGTDLKAQWDRAAAASIKLAEPFLDMNWITTGQDFELASYRLVTPTSSEVVAFLRGRAGETPIVTFQFRKESGAWKLFDVAYGGGSNPSRLSTILQKEIDEATPVVTVPRGFGPSQPFAIDGAAAPAVKEFLSKTTIHCEFARPGRCTLGQLASKVELRYVDTQEGKGAIALAFITHSIDNAGLDIQMLAVWHLLSDGRYHEQAHDDIEMLTNPRIVGMQGDAILVSGVTLGPNDAYCCPTDPTTVRVKTSGEVIDVNVERRFPRIEDADRYIPRLPFTPLKQMAATGVMSQATESDRAAFESDAFVAARRTAMLTLGLPADRVDHVEFDLTYYSYGSESGELKDHNGSDVLVFEKSGLIVYLRPSARMAGIVRRGDVLFRGKISSGGIDGYAYAFKRGCKPVPYRVLGSRYTPDDASDFSFDLRGAAPVRSANGCAISEFSATVPNATLHFGFATLD